jgi:uncharacterized protein (DUF1499 family)
MFVRLAVVALALIGLGLAVRLYMSRSGEDRLRAGEAIDIRQLREPIPGNAFLACPPDYCRATAASSPIFSLPAARLVQLWTQMMTGEPRIVIVTDEPQQHRLVIIQRTPLLRFPDIVTVEFVAIDDNRSSLAVYSRARYGSGDFGTNRRRVLAWLGRIEQLAHQ